MGTRRTIAHKSPNVENVQGIMKQENVKAGQQNVRCVVNRTSPGIANALYVNEKEKEMRQKKENLYPFSHHDNTTARNTADESNYIFLLIYRLLTA